MDYIVLMSRYTTTWDTHTARTPVGGHSRYSRNRNISSNRPRLISGAMIFSISNRVATASSDHEPTHVGVNASRIS
ncbi:hypothetical protein SCP_1203220 [Sparassis crispa]|uniref:Uncharacterized protein n=1 Tax=Sparassis crispa TaxID=139825 RepID=A0A401H120_9APHY|nr:hypothetical protein SCP_1203220 [Sparassis crispa]GBE88093.1 hypothetical protein SCP_1203220 [Sparassis crispa]